MAGALLLTASLLLPIAAAGQAGGEGANPPRLSLLDVPYLSQSEALCGGAAAAMVLRYWGARGVSAEDFAPLVDRERGGIEASVLAGAVRQRGFQALAASGSSELVQRELAGGRPVIALIEDRPGAFHFVVVVGWHARTVVLHDPARTPYMLLTPAEFERRWQASRNWMLAVTPAPHTVSRADGEQPRALPIQSTCDGLVADGVRLAQANDLGAAERLLADAAYRCPGSSALRELAGVRLLQRRWSEVRDLAGRAVEIDAGDAHAWRLLATARFIGGDHDGALDAWNAAGEPRVDLVTVNGLQRTRHRVVERLLDIPVGGVLTRFDTERARRRLDELPVAAMTRLEYVPRGAGTVDVRAQVLERTVMPTGRITWVALGLRTAASRELQLPLSSLSGGGERLDLKWRFWPNRPAAGLALHAPTALGVLSLDAYSERQPFDRDAIADARRVTARVRMANWMTAALRWEVRGGVSRWRGIDVFGTAGAAARFERGRAWARAEADLYAGGERFSTGAVQAGWRSSAARRGLELEVSTLFEFATSGTPLDLWPAGDTGEARPALLRAHPLLDGGRLRVDRLGRRLAQSSAELRHWWRVSTLPISAAIFADAARTSARASLFGHNSALADVDVGAGLRIALPGRQGTLRADLAHGLRDGRNAFAVSWSPGD